MYYINDYVKNEDKYTYEILNTSNKDEKYNCDRDTIIRILSSGIGIRGLSYNDGVFKCTNKKDSNIVDTLNFKSNTESCDFKSIVIFDTVEIGNCKIKVHCDSGDKIISFDEFESLIKSGCVNGISYSKSGKYNVEEHTYLEATLDSMLNDKKLIINRACVDYIGTLSEAGVAAFCINGKWGAINDRYEVTIPATYDEFIDMNIDGHMQFKTGSVFLVLNGKNNRPIMSSRRAMRFKGRNIVSYKENGEEDTIKIVYNHMGTSLGYATVNANVQDKGVMKYENGAYVKFIPKRAEDGSILYDDNENEIFTKNIVFNRILMIGNRIKIGSNSMHDKYYNILDGTDFTKSGYAAVKYEYNDGVKVYSIIDRSGTILNRSGELKNVFYNSLFKSVVHVGEEHAVVITMDGKYWIFSYSDKHVIGFDKKNKKVDLTDNIHSDTFDSITACDDVYYAKYGRDIYRIDESTLRVLGIYKFYTNFSVIGSIDSDIVIKSEDNKFNVFGSQGVAVGRWFDVYKKYNGYNLFSRESNMYLYLNGSLIDIGNTSCKIEAINDCYIYTINSDNIINIVSKDKCVLSTIDCKSDVESVFALDNYSGIVYIKLVDGTYRWIDIYYNRKDDISYRSVDEILKNKYIMYR